MDTNQHETYSTMDFEGGLPGFFVTENEGGTHVNSVRGFSV